MLIVNVASDLAKRVSTNSLFFFLHPLLVNWCAMLSYLALQNMKPCAFNCIISTIAATWIIIMSCWTQIVIFLVHCCDDFPESLAPSSSVTCFIRICAGLANLKLANLDCTCESCIHISEPYQIGMHV